MLNVNTKPKLNVHFLRVIQCMNVLMGRKGKKMNPTHSYDASFAGKLNVFFDRFDTGECSCEFNGICSEIPLYDNITLEEHEIAYCLSCIKPNKAPGPDGLNEQVLKDCVYQLTRVLTQLFQLLLKTVPNLWKILIVIPILPEKKKKKKELNN